MQNNISLDALRQRHEHILSTLIKQTPIPAINVKDAIHYTLFPGGKRFRPMLVYCCGILLNAPLSSLDIIAAAVELIHCYSLIHDDLPAMDNDDYRRGKLSCHRAFDEATAILVGDGMQALAIEILLQHLPQTLSITQVIDITHALVKACGPSGMVSGQSLDLTELHNPSISEEELQNVHLLKTGQLIIACINMALTAGEPTPQERQALLNFANHLGLVFQMLDDYLDRYDVSSIGKNRSSDLSNHKTTYASLFSQDTLLTMINNHFNHVHDALRLFEGRASNLLAVINELGRPLITA